jgi:hypothetical protein
LPQFPHFGRSAARDTSILFQLWQNWHLSVVFAGADWVESM